MKKKKEKIISAVATMGIILMLFGATYAYFSAQTDSGKITDLEVTANTVDVFTFEASSDAITINLNQENFTENDESQTGEAYAKATLSANNKTNSVTEHYNIYLNIDTNTFDYTSEDNKPEVLIKVVKNGVELIDDDIDGLNHYTVTDVSGKSITGFDITNKVGVITLVGDEEISTTTTTKDTWNFYITFVNYNYDQSENGGNSFKAKIEIGKPLHESCSDNTLTCTIAKLYTGVQGENAMYYHTSSLENGAGDNSYRFAGSTYALSEKATSEGYITISSYASVQKRVVEHYCDGTSTYWNYSCLSAETNYFTLNYDENNTQYVSYDDALKQAFKDGYIDSIVNNYICFGSEEETCPYDNLYRIIGIFDGKVKLVKEQKAKSNLLGEDGDYADNDGYYWSRYNNGVSNKLSGYANNWAYSFLNTINLNINYLNNIGTKWADKIASVTWKVGGNTTDRITDANSVSPKSIYDGEILYPSNQVNPNYDAKIGLMYISDYAFGANYESNNWASNSNISDNFLYNGYGQYFITRVSNLNLHFFDTAWTGGLMFSGIAIALGNIRPTFYLNSDVEIDGKHTGTILDPYRIKI